MTRSALLLLSLCCGFAGCATAGRMRETRGEGETRQYETTFDLLWDAAVLAVVEHGLELRELQSADSASGYIVASSDESFAWTSYGELVAAFVDCTPVSPATCTLEVVSKRKLATTIFAPDWTEPIFRTVESYLPQTVSTTAGYSGTGSTRLSVADLDFCQARLDSVLHSPDAPLRITDAQLRDCRNEAEGDSDAMQACLADRSRQNESGRAARFLDDCLSERR